MMSRLASHRAGRRVLAVLLLGAVKVAIRIAPARTLRVFHSCCNENPACAPAPDPRRVGALRALAQSIDGASRLMSGSCLESALASCMAARLLGTPVSLRIGVDQVRPDMRAHAWVECAGTVLVGGAPVAAFDR
jgi:hypothetical protein